MRICRAQNWSVEQFLSLSDKEQELWLDYEEYRNGRILEYIDTLKEKEAFIVEVATLLRLSGDLI